MFPAGKGSFDQPTWFPSLAMWRNQVRKPIIFLQLDLIRNFLAKFWNWNGSGTERTLILGRGNGTELIPILI